MLKQYMMIRDCRHARLLAATRTNSPLQKPTRRSAIAGGFSTHGVVWWTYCRAKVAQRSVLDKVLHQIVPQKWYKTRASQRGWITFGELTPSSTRLESVGLLIHHRADPPQAPAIGTIVEQ